MIQAIYEKLSHSQGPPRCCLLESLKWSHKGQDQTWLKFWWVEHHSLNSHNMMQANFDALSYSQEAARCCHLNMTYFKRSKRSDKGQHRTHPRFWCGEYHCKITKQYLQFLQSYRVHNAAWPWASLNVRKDHTKVNVELVRDFYVENIYVKLEHDTGNLPKSYRVHKVPDVARLPARPPACPGNDNTLQSKG